MPLHRLFAGGLWLVVTVASTAMVWTATSIVAADVTDRPAVVLAQKDVVSELQSGASAADASPTTTIPATGGSTTVVSGGRGPAPVSPSAPLPAAPPSEDPQPGITTAPSSPPTTATAPPAAPVAPAPSRPAAPVDPRPTATYSTAGGVVRVACSGFLIELISAIPSNGYSVDVVSAGPGNVEVHFVRPGQDLSVKAVCFGQPIRYYDQAPPRRPGSS